MRIGPLLATADWLTHEQVEAARQEITVRGVAFDATNIGTGRNPDGITLKDPVLWETRRFACCPQLTYMAPTTWAESRTATAPRCPICEPWEYLDRHSQGHRARLAVELAKTDAVHTMLVALDLAQQEGRTDVSKLRHPDDVRRIADLEAANRDLRDAVLALTGMTNGRGRRSAAAKAGEP